MFYWSPLLWYPWFLPSERPLVTCHNHLFSVLQPIHLSDFTACYVVMLNMKSIWLCTLGLPDSQGPKPSMSQCQCNNLTKAKVLCEISVWVPFLHLSCFAFGFCHSVLLLCLQLWHSLPFPSSMGGRSGRISSCCHRDVARPPSTVPPARLFWCGECTASWETWK